MSGRSAAMDGWRSGLEVVVDVTQNLLNADYKAGLYKERFRYPREDPVVVLCNGLYQECTISHYFHAIPVPSLHPPGALIEIHDYLPTVIVNFVGCSYKLNEEMPENELISCRPNELCHIQGMLLAHQWNTYQRIRRGKTEKEMGSTVFFVDTEQYLQLQKLWQEATGNTMTFAEFCGRKA